MYKNSTWSTLFYQTIEPILRWLPARVKVRRNCVRAWSGRSSGSSACSSSAGRLASSSPGSTFSSYRLAPASTRSNNCARRCSRSSSFRCSSPKTWSKWRLAAADRHYNRVYGWEGGFKLQAGGRGNLVFQGGGGRCQINGMREKMRKPMIV